MADYKSNKESFIELVSGAPFSFEEVARLALKCDDPYIRSVGMRFCKAYEEMIEMLDKTGIELG